MISYDKVLRAAIRPPTYLGGSLYIWLAAHFRFEIELSQGFLGD